MTEFRQGRYARFRSRHALGIMVRIKLLRTGQNAVQGGDLVVLLPHHLADEAHIAAGIPEIGIIIDLLKEILGIKDGSADELGEVRNLIHLNRLLGEVTELMGQNGFHFSPVQGIHERQADVQVLTAVVFYVPKDGGITDRRIAFAVDIHMLRFPAVYILHDVVDQRKQLGMIFPMNLRPFLLRRLEDHENGLQHSHQGPRCRNDDRQKESQRPPMNPSAFKHGPSGQTGGPDDGHIQKNGQQNDQEIDAEQAVDFLLQVDGQGRQISMFVQSHGCFAFFGPKDTAIFTIFASITPSP